MATKLTENYITSKFNINEIVFTDPTSETTTNDFEIDNIDSDSIFILINALSCPSGNVNMIYTSGTTVLGSKFGLFTIPSGTFGMIKIETGPISNPQGVINIKLTTSFSTPMNSSGLKVALVKEKYVKNN